jgi:hypothetical protein
MRATVIDCAGCGAPLGGAVALAIAGDLVPCLYCGALLRFSGSGSEVQHVVERQLTPELIAKAREAALRGGRAEAIAVCVNEGITPASAAAAVDDVIKSVANKAVFSQTLNAIGFTLVLGSCALVLGGIAVLVWPSPARLAGLAFILFGGLNLAFLGRGVVTSVRFWMAARATATIKSSINVGPTGFSDGCQVFSLAIDVTPDRGGVAPFHTRLVVPVRPQSVAKFQVGKRIGVRFAAGGEWLLADGDRQV